MCRILALLMLASTVAVGQTSYDVTRWLDEVQHGDANAAFWLGVAYERGKGVQQNFATAIAWYLQSASQRNADAQNALGQMYEEGRGVTRDLLQAAKWYRLACENRPDYGGAGQGCNNLAFLYAEGRGVELNRVQAYKYFKLGRNGKAVAELVSSMTVDEVTEAQRQVEKWHEIHPDD